VSEEIEITYAFGQKRYNCPLIWEGGAKCTWNHCTLEELRDHMSAPHTRSGKPLPGARQVVSPILGADGKQIVHEQTVDEQFQGFKFKE
jgi:hypothetical protein